MGFLAYFSIFFVIFGIFSLFLHIFTLCSTSTSINNLEKRRKCKWGRVIYVNLKALDLNCGGIEYVVRGYVEFE